MGVLKTLNEMMDKDSIEASDRAYEEDKILIEKSFTSLQVSIATEIKKIMKQKNLGVNEMRRQLGVSPTTFNKLKKCEGNPTIEIVSLLSKISGKKAEIVWR